MLMSPPIDAKRTNEPGTSASDCGCEHKIAETNCAEVPPKADVRSTEDLVVPSSVIPRKFFESLQSLPTASLFAAR